MTINYRESHDLFACSGILFNHESPLRGHEFVTKKITRGLTKVKNGSQDCILLGNLDAKRDWGHAADYVEAMNMIMNNNKPDDFVVSSGATSTVKDFVDKCLKTLNFDYAWEGEGLEKVVINKKSNKPIVKIDKKFFRPAEVDILMGDPSKIKKELNWKPKHTLDSLIEEMIAFEINNPNLSF